MKDEEVDRILLQGLSNEPSIEPSARFTARVMAAVRSEAAIPPPLKFPWPLFLPGPVMLAGVSAWVFADALRSTAPPPPAVSVPMFTRVVSFLSTILESAHMYAIDWLLLSLAIVWISLKLSAKFAGARN